MGDQMYIDTFDIQGCKSRQIKTIKDKKGTFSDYSAVYKRILGIDPSLSDYVQRAKAADVIYRGRKREMLPSFMEGGITEEEIFDCFLSNILFMALKRWEACGGDLQDFVQTRAMAFLLTLRIYEKSGANLSFLLFSTQENAKRIEKGEGISSQNEKMFQHYLLLHDCAECRAGRYCKETISWVFENCKHTKNDAKELATIASLLSPVSLEEADNDSREAIDFDSYETDAAKWMLSDAIVDCLFTLEPQEAEVLRFRFGLDGKGPRTFVEISKCYGVTHERIRQIEARGLRKMRHPSRVRRLREFLE